MKTLTIILMMSGSWIGYVFMFFLLLVGIIMIAGTSMYKRKTMKLSKYEKKWNALVLYIFPNGSILLRSKSSLNEGWIPVIFINDYGDILPESSTTFSEIMMDADQNKRVRKQGDLGYFNIKTGHLIPPQYTGAEPFKDGRAQVQTYEQDILFIDEKGKIV